jgi:hypothetical protein
MSTSTAPHDLASIKHALELGLILAALVLAARGSWRHETGRCLAAPGIAAIHVQA